MANESEQSKKNSGKKNDVPNPSNPFFLNHSDHPGMVLVSKKLNGDNYQTWCRSMKLSLSAKNKIGFVDGTVAAPEKKSDEFDAWQQCNDMVLSWLLNSLEPEIIYSVIYYSTASEIWQDLEEHFSQGNASRIYELQREIASLKQGEMTISVYYTKMKSLWEELASYNTIPTCTCGAMKKHQEHEQQYVLMQFLMGLNESYSGPHGQILLMNPLPNLRRAYALVNQDEKQRSVVSSSTHVIDEPAAMAVRRNSKPADQNYSTNSNSGNSDLGRKRPKCSHCGNDGHYTDTCWKKKNGYPSWHRLHKSGGNRGNTGMNRTSFSTPVAQSLPSMEEIRAALRNLTNAQCQRMLSAMKETDTNQEQHSLPQANMASSFLSDLSKLKCPSHWIIDSVASDHFTKSENLLTEKSQNTTLPPVQLPSGEKGQHH